MPLGIDPMKHLENPEIEKSRLYRIAMAACPLFGLIRPLAEAPVCLVGFLLNARFCYRAHTSAWSRGWHDGFLDKSRGHSFEHL
jgi:hypothetical protein